MPSPYFRFHDQFQELIDSIVHDSDPAQRLANLQLLYKESIPALIRARDEASYELRVKYAGEDAAQLSGISRRHIDYWARRWRTRNMLPPLRQKQRIDLSDAIDLTPMLE